MSSDGVVYIDTPLVRSRAVSKLPPDKDKGHGKAKIETDTKSSRRDNNMNDKDKEKFITSTSSGGGAAAAGGESTVRGESFDENRLALDAMAITVRIDPAAASRHSIFDRDASVHHTPPREASSGVRTQNSDDRRTLNDSEPSVELRVRSSSGEGALSPVDQNMTDRISGERTRSVNIAGKVVIEHEVSEEANDDYPRKQPQKASRRNASENAHRSLEIPDNENDSQSSSSAHHHHENFDECRLASMERDVSVQERSTTLAPVVARLASPSHSHSAGSPSRSHSTFVAAPSRLASPSHSAASHSAHLREPSKASSAELARHLDNTATKKAHEASIWYNKHSYLASDKFLLKLFLVLTIPELLVFLSPLAYTPVYEETLSMDVWCPSLNWQIWAFLGSVLIKGCCLLYAALRFGTLSSATFF